MCRMFMQGWLGKEIDRTKAKSLLQPFLSGSFGVVNIAAQISANGQ